MSDRLNQLATKQGNKIMKIEAGKFYQTRAGAVFGPMVWDEKSQEWKANGREWCGNGEYYFGKESYLDLICPVSIYPEQPYEFGQDIEVSDDDKNWYKRKFIALGPYGMTVTVNENCNPASWNHHRAIPQKPTRDEVLDAVKKCRKVHHNDMVMISGKTIDAMIELLEGEE